MIYGGIDGIITTFAVVAGFSGAGFSNETTTVLSEKTYTKRARVFARALLR